MSVWQEAISEKHNVWLIAARGRLDQELTPALEESLNQMLAKGVYFLLVDMQEISYINSGGLRCLVSAWRKARQQNGDLVLSGLNDRLQEIFAMVGFDKVFQIYPSRAEGQTAITAVAMANANL